MKDKLTTAYRLIWEELETLPEPLRNDANVILARLDCLLKRLDKIQGAITLVDSY